LNIKQINIYTKIANKIEKSKNIQSIIKSADSNPALFNSLFVAGIAIAIRPSTILLTPSKDSESKKDKVYACSHSIATGLVDLVSAFAIFIPLNKYLDKVSNKLKDSKNSIYYQNNKICDSYKSLSNRFIKISLLPLFAFLKFVAVKPIADRIKSRKDK